MVKDYFYKKSLEVNDKQHIYIYNHVRTNLTEILPSELPGLSFHYIYMYYLFTQSVPYAQTHMGTCTQTQMIHGRWDCSLEILPHGNRDEDDVVDLEL